MPRGGARARSGPPPNPNALQRARDGHEWQTLPVEGRAGDPPAWPLPRPSKRELSVWAELWAKPQAVAWESMSQDHQVAMYVRRFVQAEAPKAPPSLGTLVRQLGDDLGLTIAGLHRNQWKIGAKPEDQPAAQTTSRRRSARDRLTVVDGQGA